LQGISAQGGNEAKHFETPYVVKLHRVALLAAALPVFRFDHPNRDATIDNNRYIALRFERGADTPGAMMHGFAGYFDAELYKDVHLSIFPPTHTPNMFSWFPIYFPLRTPVYVPSVRCSAWHVVCAGLSSAFTPGCCHRGADVALRQPRQGLV
jgi:hypothetical protein